MTSTTTTLEEMSVDRRNTPAPGIHERRVRTRKKKKKRRVQQSTEKVYLLRKEVYIKKVKQGCNKARKKCTYSGRKSSNKKRKIKEGCNKVWKKCTYSGSKSFLREQVKKT